MKHILFSAMFCFAVLAFAASPVQAGPFDLSDDSYVAQPNQF